MKRLSILLIFLIVFLIPLFSNQMTSDLEFLSDFSPGIEASEEERRVISFIEDRLANNETEYSTLDFKDANGYYSYSKIIEVEIKGIIKDELITIIPLYSNYGIASALSLIEEYSKNQPKISLRFLFIGANDQDNQNFGSKNYLDHYFPQVPSCFVYLNFEEIPSSIKITPGTNGIGSPFFLVSKTMKSLKKAEINTFFSNVESILMRMSVFDVDTHIKEYLLEGYPAIQIDTLKKQMKHWKQFHRKSLSIFIKSFLNLLKMEFRWNQIPIIFLA